jgi:branched-chain amino acid transport system substrate-binding protein
MHYALYKTYRAAVAKYYPKNPVGVFGLNGRSNAALFAVAFEKLLDSTKPLTRENLVAVLDQLKDAQVGGARNVSFTAGDHRGTRQEGIIRARERRLQDGAGVSPLSAGRLCREDRLRPIRRGRR